MGMIDLHINAATASRQEHTQTLIQQISETLSTINSVNEGDSTQKYK